MSFTFDGDFHVYGLEWNSTKITYYADGVPVYSLNATCLHQPIGMDFDRETMPGWMGLPHSGKLPDRPYVIDYVRAWKKKS